MGQFIGTYKPDGYNTEEELETMGLVGRHDPDFDEVEDNANVVKKSESLDRVKCTGTNFLEPSSSCVPWVSIGPVEQQLWVSARLK